MHFPLVRVSPFASPTWLFRSTSVLDPGCGKSVAKLTVQNNYVVVVGVVRDSCDATRFSAVGNQGYEGVFEGSHDVRRSERRQWAIRDGIIGLLALFPRQNGLETWLEPAKSC